MGEPERGGRRVDRGSAKESWVIYREGERERKSERERERKREREVTDK